VFDTECSYNLSLHSRLSYIESSNSNLRKQLRKQRCSSFAYAKSLPCEILLNALFVDLLVANALFFDTPHMRFIRIKVKQKKMDFGFSQK